MIKIRNLGIVGNSVGAFKGGKMIKIGVLGVVGYSVVFNP